MEKEKIHLKNNEREEDIALTRSELRGILGGPNLRNSLLSPLSHMTTCSTTCPPGSDFVAISVKCSGPCKAIENESVGCISNDNYYVYASCNEEN